MDSSVGETLRMRPAEVGQNRKFAVAKLSSKTPASSGYPCPRSMSVAG